MATGNHETPLMEGNNGSGSVSSPPLELNERKSRISLWCILFWIVALAGLTASSLALQNYPMDDDLKTAKRLYVAADCSILAAIIITIIHLYFVTENEILKLVGGCLFIVGGILHIAGTSKLVDTGCVDKWCRTESFGADFMMEYLSIFIGIDIITFYFDTRILRLIGYCCLLSICCLMLGSFANHQAGMYGDSDESNTSQSAYFITGIVSGILFVVLLVIQVGNKNINHNETTTYVHLFLGFVLMTGAGLIFYTLGGTGYQTLLIIATAVIIAYELQYM